MQLNKFILFLCFFGILIPGEFGSSGLVNHADQHLHIDGSSISLLWIIPFIGILLSIAIFKIPSLNIIFTLEILK